MSRAELVNIKRHLTGALKAIEKQINLTPICKVCYPEHKVSDRCTCNPDKRRLVK